jgi:hypothetical protein
MTVRYQICASLLYYAPCERVSLSVMSVRPALLYPFRSVISPSFSDFSIHFGWVISSLLWHFFGSGKGLEIGVYERMRTQSHLVQHNDR